MKKKRKRNWSILLPSQDTTLLLYPVMSRCGDPVSAYWNCPLEYGPLYYRRLVDDIFVLFNSPEDLKRSHSYLNSCHPNISFTIENEKDNIMSFFDINIIRKKAGLPLLSTANQLLAEVISILTVCYHPVPKLACYIHYYIDVSGFAQIGLSFT